MSKQAPCQLILALDLETREEALAMLDHLGDSIKWVKIGLQLFTAYGPDFVREIADRGYKVFLDLKLHDIPNTVAKAVQSIATLPVELLTLHASGGGEMLEWANKSRNDHAPHLNLLAVTVLTFDGRSPTTLTQYRRPLPKTKSSTSPTSPSSRACKASSAPL
jgi:orotidine-5'-phosphate decarboxylase